MAINPPSDHGPHGHAEVLCERLGRGAPARRFAEIVIEQAGRPPGATASERREASVVEAVCAILSHAASLAEPVDRGGARLDPVATLAADPVLLSAFFQNVDLLYQADAPEADRVGAWILAAVGRIGRTDSGGSEDGERSVRPAPEGG